MSYHTLKRVYLILAGAAFLMFFGHGAWAGFENAEEFRGLASDSLNNLFGTSTNLQDWAISTAVRTAGWTDISISLVIVVFAIGVYRGHGALARIATSRFAIAIFAWGAFYGLVNAVSTLGSSRPVGCQKSVGCHAARSYSWMRPPRTSWRWRCGAAANASACSQRSDGSGADRPRPRWGR